jgi:hypothetical protein
MPQRSKITTAALLAASLALVSFVGCETTWPASSNRKAATPVIQPDDFVGEAQAKDDTDTNQETTLISTDQADTPSEDSSAADTRQRQEQALPVDAMVGHINGEAVYADQIFDVNLIAQLESFGRRFDGDEFRDAAEGVIQSRLQGIIINKLILGEAERNLQEAQRRGVEGRIQAEREELLRFYGQGSLAKAKAEFRKERGKELDQYLTEFREELIIGSYIRSKVLPKIVVNQRDVERYYADNIDKYQQPDSRTIRLIRAIDEDASLAITDKLRKGRAFEKVAADADLNQYNPNNAGIFNSGNAIPGDKVIGVEQVNEALIKLKSGEHAGPITTGDATFFVQVVERTPGVEISLADAQIDIEQKLRAAQFEKYALRFRMDLLKRGSYSDPTEMGNKLLEIAYARYDR